MGRGLHQRSAYQEAHLKPGISKRSETMKIRSVLIKAAAVVVLSIVLINGSLARSPIPVGALQATQSATAASIAPASLPLPMESAIVPQTVTYGEVGGVKLILDVYQPATSATSLPAVILIHGGAGSFRDRSVEDDPAHGLDANRYV